MSTCYKLNSNIWITEIELSVCDVRSVLICDEKHAVIWDTLSHPDDMGHFLPEIGDRELTIIYSHADWDHIWGTGAFPHRKTEIIGHSFCQKRFTNDVPVKLDEKKSEDSTQWEDVKLIPPNKTFQQELIVNLNDTTLILQQLQGHTEDSIVAFLPDKGILLMGDTVETPLPSVPPECPIDLWIEELQRWESDSRVKSVIPSHGIIGGREIIQQNIIYLQNLKDGHEFTLPQMTDFYSETHKTNILNVKMSNNKKEK